MLSFMISVWKRNTINVNTGKKEGKIFVQIILTSLTLASAAAAKSLQSCPTLCDPIDRSPPGSSIPGILQARTLEWVAISFSNAWKWSEREVAQLCPTLSDPMDCSLPGSSVHGIFQARVLEWGAIAFSGHWHLGLYNYVLSFAGRWNQAKSKHTIRSLLLVKG